MQKSPPRKPQTDSEALEDESADLRPEELASRDAERDAAMQALVDQAQELDMGY